MKQVYTYENAYAHGHYMSHSGKDPGNNKCQTFKKMSKSSKKKSKFFQLIEKCQKVRKKNQKTFNFSKIVKLLKKCSKVQKKSQKFFNFSKNVKLLKKCQ